ncbi:MAG TPA: hypothetical protein VKA67_14080, partial [Verrucomicrobiae bacterium]|nr:hypothetical protein [Verrucomicrobiae bacterium]
EPGHATLTPEAKHIVRVAVHEARKGEAVSIVVADPAETATPSSAPKLWRLRFQAVRDAILRSEGGLVQI